MGRRIAVIAALLGILTAACGGEAGPEEYFETLSDVNATYAESIDSLPAASTSGSIDDARSFFVGIDTALGDAVTHITEMTPPEGAVAAHGDFVAAAENYSDVTGQIAAQAEVMETTDDLLALANDPDHGVAIFRAAATGFVVACGELQALSNSTLFEEVDVDLMCGALGR